MGAVVPIYTARVPRASWPVQPALVVVLNLAILAHDRLRAVLMQAEAADVSATVERQMERMRQVLGVEEMPDLLRYWERRYS